MSCSSSCLQPSTSGKGVPPSAISQQHVGSLETEDLVEEILFSTAKWRVLIIACDAYATRPLSKCKEAAEVIRKEIERCWPNTTEIQLVPDPGPDALRDACEEFVQRPTVNQRLFLYFAGHGFEKDGQNYMVPVLPGPSVCLQHLRWKLEKGCILFAAMDCCRVHDPFYPDEPLEVLTEPYRYTKPLKTDYMYLFSCLSGEEKRDDIEFAEALKPCFSKPKLKLSEVQQTVKDSMPRHRCDSTMSLRGHPVLFPTLLGRNHEVRNYRMQQPTAEQDAELYMLYWPPCIFLLATILDVSLLCAAALGLIRVQCSSRVTFFLCISSYLWCSFAHIEAQHAPSCSFRLVNTLVQNWKTVDVIHSWLRTTFGAICQIIAELFHEESVSDAVVSILVALTWFVFRGKILAVFATWRDEVSPLSQARAARHWMYVFCYAVFAAFNNARMLQDGSDGTARWIEFYWQSFVLVCAFSGPYTLVYRCDPLCSSRRALHVAACGALGGFCALSVLLFVMWHGMPRPLFLQAGWLIEYLAVIVFYPVVSVWQRTWTRNCMKRVGHLRIYSNIASKVSQSEFSTEHATLPSCFGLLEWYSVDCSSVNTWQHPCYTEIWLVLKLFLLTCVSHMVWWFLVNTTSLVQFALCAVWLVDTRFRY